MGILNKIVFRFDFDVCDKDEDDDGNYKFWGNLLQFGICHENPALLKSYYDCTGDYYDSSSNSNSSNEKKRSAILIQLLAGEAADRIDPPLSNNQNNDDTTASASLTDQQAIDESLDALRSVFGEENVPDPAVSKVTRWRQDPWSCGSYSFAKVGSIEAVELGEDERGAPTASIIFDEELGAIRAVEELNDEDNWRFGMRVRLESGMAPSAARKAAGLPPRPKEKKPQFNARCAPEGSSSASSRVTSSSHSVDANFDPPMVMHPRMDCTGVGAAEAMVRTAIRVVVARLTAGLATVLATGAVAAVAIARR